jgi:23S rRNA (cytosine1962-C5)-methyltransferase
MAHTRGNNAGRRDLRISSPILLAFMSTLPRLILRPAKDKALRKGYPWIFANQIDGKSDRPDRGAVVQLLSAAGDVLGLALYHDESLIAGRFLTTNVDADIGPSFFAERIRRAVDLRRAAFPEATHARLIFGESDGLPGLVVDRYGPPGYEGGAVTYTCLSYGMELHREALLDAIVAEVRPAAIVERNDSSMRRKDGLQESTGILRGSYDGNVTIEEAGARFAVDVLGGPKTGFFIDQRLNRLTIRPFAHGRRVLDVFSADGGFGLHAALGGATRVHLLDASGDALERAMANAERTGVADLVTTESADALDRLGELARDGADFDMVVLDPPSFASSKRHLEQARRAYQRINITALQILPPGGFLATASCSQAVSEDEFLKIVRYSAHRAGAPLRLLHRGTQPADHPVLDSMPETQYLKFYLFQKLRDEVPG